MCNRKSWWTPNKTTIYKGVLVKLHHSRSDLRSIAMQQHVARTATSSARDRTGMSRNTCTCNLNGKTRNAWRMSWEKISERQNNRLWNGMELRFSWQWRFILWPSANDTLQSDRWGYQCFWKTYCHCLQNTVQDYFYAENGDSIFLLNIDNHPPILSQPEKFSMSWTGLGSYPMASNMEFYSIIIKLWFTSV
jgi:hypothetical protein